MGIITRWIKPISLARWLASGPEAQVDELAQLRQIGLGVSRRCLDGRVTEQRLGDRQGHLVVDHQRLGVGMAQPMGRGGLQQRCAGRLAVSQRSGHVVKDGLHFGVEPAFPQGASLEAVNKRQHFVTRKNTAGSTLQ